MNLDNTRRSQIEKILQLYEASNRRMGVVIVGPSGSGKSTLWKVLKVALAKLNKKVGRRLLKIPRWKPDLDEISIDRL